MEDLALEANLLKPEISFDSNKSYLVSPQSQKILRMATFEIQGMYEYIYKINKETILENLQRINSRLKQGRYQVINILGNGSFGKVVEAIDHLTSTRVAVKITKHKPGFTMHTNNEIVNLKKINQHESGSKYFVKMLDYFDQDGYLCIVFELFTKTLYKYLTESKNISLEEIVDLASQFFKALKILQTLNIVHCDLKPENIMLCKQEKNYIKIIDFGSSCEAGKSIYKFVQSRFYRSPEVTLRLDYGLAIDMWSVGCILAELYTSKPIFSSKNEFMQMAKTIRILGPFPRKMLEKSLEYKKYISFIRCAPKTNSNLRNLVLDERQAPDSSPLFDKFIDLLGKCFNYDPNSRITPCEALNHPFICTNSSVPSEVPWPSLPYTRSFLLQKVGSRPSYCRPLVDSISQNTSANSKNPSMSRNSPRIISSDEDLQSERPGSYVLMSSGSNKNSNVTPRF